MSLRLVAAVEHWQDWLPASQVELMLSGTSLIKRMSGKAEVVSLANS